MARGRYKIVRKIADGGMAEIFLGTQHGVEGFERPVVLKRILAPLLADPKFRDMLIDEAHVAMSLIHGNIVQVLDLGQAKGRYYLVLELVDGWDLNHVIHRMNAAGLPIPPELALYIIAEVCRALAYAHARTRAGQPMGIVHRDVSPHNVLLSEQGEVKLTDFGIAKAVSKRGEKTLQGVIKGKLAFMSPEQASGAELDARSDLFSVGTMLYLMLVGRRPFEAPTDLESILRVQRCEFTPAEEAKPDLDPRVAAVIAKAMRKAPNDRYQTAEELLIELETLQRTVFQPAGQTELKRWLGELEKRDGAPSAARSRGGPAPTTAELPSLDEADFVLEEDEPPAPSPRRSEETMADISGIPTVPLPTIAPPPATPPPPPTIFDPRPPAGLEDAIAEGRRATEPSSVTDLPARGGRRGTLGMLLVAIGAAAGYLLWPANAHKPAPVPPAPEPPKPSPKPVPVATTPSPSPAAPAPDARPAAPDARAASPAPADAARPGAASANDAATEDDDDEENEESLLAQREPNAEEEIIGDKEEDVAPAARPAAPSKPAAKPPTKPSAPGKPAWQPVSVKIVSKPEGAVIRLGRRVFGRAPMSLRFRPGIKYDLSFVKQGYATATKSFTPGARANQVVTVSLKKKPEGKKRKGFFQRLFGR